MFKKIFIFFWFFFVSSNLVFAGISSHCNETSSDNFIEKISSATPKYIEVTPNNNRNWQKNNIRMLTEPSRVFPAKYKKRFNAKVEVTFDNNLKCVFKARIRAHGDMKDHIYLKDGSVIQSIDVHLQTGHIDGITKFKLFIPNTRGMPNDEIFITELLRELNFLAPRTSYVEVRLNEKKTTMLFQEKAAKEMIEYNLRREGPILEGDSRYIFPLLAKLPDNELSNLSVGMLAETEKAVRVELAKQTNSRWNSKTGNHSKISFHSLTLLNRAFLLYANGFKNSKNNFNYYNYNLDNNLLGLNDPKNILKLDIYNLILFAADGWHGMVPSNRKFYWNALENYFEPIYYDGNVNLNKDPLYINLPFSDYLLEAFIEAEKRIREIDVNRFSKKLHTRGVYYNKEEVEKKLNIINENLNKLKIKISSIDQNLISDNKNKKITEEMWGTYINLILNLNSKTSLILKKPKNNDFLVCNGRPLNCTSRIFNKDEIESLLESELTLNDSPYQYVGEYPDIGSLQEVKNSIYKKIKFKESNFYFDKNIKFDFNSDTNEFNIYQNEPAARAFFYKGSLNDININFYGYENPTINEIKNFPIDRRGLTGCLSLIHLNVNDIKINSSNSSCEDTLNLINVKGFIDEINIRESFSDGLDVDFSKVTIDKINIFSSKNDCVDLSAGQYELNKINLENCGDKALSVGEKSYLKLNEIIAKNSNTGIASKDSSITKLTDAYLTNLKTCISAYNKKQEYYGGFLEVQNIECKNYEYKTDVDNNSKVIIKNEL